MFSAVRVSIFFVCSTVRFSKAWAATIKIPSKSPEVMVVSVPIVPMASWPKAAKKSWAIGP